MKVQVDITLEDYQAFLKAITAQLKKIPPSPLSIALVIGFPVIVGVAAGFLAKSAPENPNRLPLLLIGFVCGVVFLYAFAILFSKLQRKRLLPSDGSYMLGPQEIEIREDGIRIASRSHESLFQWSLIAGPDVAKEHIFVMVDRLAGIIVPRRCFASEAEQEKFLEEVRRRARRQRADRIDGRRGMDSGWTLWTSWTG